MHGVHRPRLVIREKSSSFREQTLDELPPDLQLPLMLAEPLYQRLRLHWALQIHRIYDIDTTRHRIKLEETHTIFL